MQVIAFREDAERGKLGCVRMGGASPKSLMLGEWGRSPLHLWRRVWRSCSLCGCVEALALRRLLSAVPACRTQTLREGRVAQVQTQAGSTLAASLLASRG